MSDEYHLPVMVDEVLEAAAPVPAGLIVDATVGGGGHAAALASARPDCALLGLDQDPDAVAAASARLGHLGDRVTVVAARFDRIDDAVRAHDPEGAVFILFDLGVSSHQLDQASRGFSYRNDGPLDMRMDPDAALSAHTIVNGYAQAELAAVLRRNADERFAGRIARAIVAARPVHSTTQLAEIVRDAIPAATRRRGGHPATRTFQALRIEVNAEMQVLEAALPAALSALRAGGRCAVISYHSGEDRRVKDVFRTAAGLRGDHPIEYEPEYTLVRRRGIVPSDAEIDQNPRASAARLRVIERARGLGGAPS